jgi:hypothetical protein
MAGKTPQPQATQERTLTPMLTHCPECGHRIWWGLYHRSQGGHPGRGAAVVAADPALSQPTLQPVPPALPP